MYIVHCTMPYSKTSLNREYNFCNLFESFKEIKKCKSLTLIFVKGNYCPTFNTLFNYLVFIEKIIGAMNSYYIVVFLGSKSHILNINIKYI